MLRKLILFFTLYAFCIQGEAPFAVYLTWQKSPDTTMIIQWITSSKDGDDQVYFSDTGDANWEEKKAVHTPFPENKPYFLHRIEIENLKPNHLHHFRIGKEKTIYKFKTLPSVLDDTSLTFVVGGDAYHDSLDLLKSTNKQAAKKNPHFALIGGDIAYSAGRSSLLFHLKLSSEDVDRWLQFLKAWHDDMVTEDGLLIPILTTIGNHDVMGRFDQTPKEALYYYTFFPTPKNQGYNVLDFGNYLSLFILDTNHTHPISGKQTEWLQDVMSKRKFIPFKMALYHVGAYPSVRSFYNSVAKKIRKHWVPIFEENHLKIAFEHHDHAYKRTHPIRNGAVDPEGILYIGDGAWGVEHPRKSKNLDKWYLAKAVPLSHFVHVTIKDKYVYIKAFDSNGNAIDESIR